MPIQNFPATPAGQAAAFAVANPKNVTFTGSGFEVRSGADYVAPPAQVVTSVTPRQARLALLGAGKLAAVEAALAAMTGAQGEAARITWEFATEVRRDDPLIAALGPALNLTGAQIDALFVTAAGL
jgi:hypothetical protein